MEKKAKRCTILERDAHARACQLPDCEMHFVSFVDGASAKLFILLIAQSVAEHFPLYHYAISL